MEVLLVKGEYVYRWTKGCVCLWLYVPTLASRSFYSRGKWIVYIRLFLAFLSLSSVKREALQSDSKASDSQQWGCMWLKYLSGESRRTLHARTSIFHWLLSSEKKECEDWLEGQIRATFLTWKSNLIMPLHLRDLFKLFRPPCIIRCMPLDGWCDGLKWKGKGMIFLSNKCH